MNTPPLPWRLQSAIQALEQGGVIACPTEAVWGLSCDPWQREAVERLLTLKERPMSKGLILVASDESQLEPLLASLNKGQRAKLSLSWPGPSTWLVPHLGRVPAWVSGEFDTVAVRVSAHPVVRSLCAAWGAPLVSTSANRAGCQPALAAFQVRRYFADSLAAILPGSLGAERRPSVIRDAVTDVVIRS